MGARVTVNYLAVAPQNEAPVRELPDRLGDMHFDACLTEADVHDGEAVRWG